MKKKKKNNNGEITFESKELKRKEYVNEDFKKMEAFIIALIIVVICFGLLYFLNGKYVTKDKFQEETTTTTSSVSYDNTIITVDKMFKISDEEYMVILYDPSDKSQDVLYGNLSVTYKKDIPLYSVELNNAMNKKAYNKDGKSNEKPTNASEVLVTGPTLITFKNGKVTSFITDKEKIVEKLK